MLNDLRGEPTTSTKAEAIASYDQAVNANLLYVGDPLATNQQALAADPEFILGLTMQGMFSLMGNASNALPDAAASLQKVETLEDKANTREKGHIAAARAWYEGDFAASSIHWDEILREHPRDVFALQMGHLLDFYTGNAANLRDRVARVLPAWDDSVPGYGPVLGLYAFGLEESGDYRRAEENGRQSVELDMRDSWGVHAVAHVLEMEGRQAEGDAWLADTSTGWAEGNFTVHNWWHQALFRLDLGNLDGALQLYDQKIYYEEQEYVEELLDSAALLWRLDLLGVELSDRWERLAHRWLPLAGDGRYPFNDMHAMMCFAKTEREAEADGVIAALEQSATGEKTNAMMARVVGLPVCRAIRAFVRGNYQQVVDELLPVRYDTRLFGGSHAQRDVISQTLIEAAIRDGQRSLAGALLAERSALKTPTAASFTARAQTRRG